MSDLVAIAYEDLATAQRVVGRLAEPLESHQLELDDCVVVERRDDGKVKLHQPSLAGMGALGGAVWGGLIGLIFLVPLLGAAVGAAAGAVGGALTDTGVNDDFMRRLGEELQPGRAAVILLVRKAVPDRLLPQIREKGVVLQTSLSRDDEAALQAALSAAH
jgi:uncharacterized membrane protein